MAVRVKVHANESQEALLRRFRKEVNKSRILSDHRRHRWHVPKSELRRLERKKAIRRSRRQDRGSSAE